MPDAKQLLALCRKQGVMLAVTESCTGGMIAARLTDIPGSSEVFERGFVTYSNKAKQEMLGVAPTLIKKYGVVSAEVAKAMAVGALKHSKAQLSIAVTGIAGPGGGSKSKPVGLVYIAAGYERVTCVKKFHFKGDRQKIRQQSVDKALEMAAKMLTPARVVL